MSKLLQVDFTYTGPFGDEMAVMLKDLAKSINQEPGFIWKIWTVSQRDKLGGGIYLFEDEQSAQNYLAMHSARLQKMGITNIRGHVFDINQDLSMINHGPVQTEY